MTINPLTPATQSKPEQTLFSWICWNRVASNFTVQQYAPTLTFDFHFYYWEPHKEIGWRWHPPSSFACPGLLPHSTNFPSWADCQSFPPTRCFSRPHSSETLLAGCLWMEARKSSNPPCPYSPKASSSELLWQCHCHPRSLQTPQPARPSPPVPRHHEGCRRTSWHGSHRLDAFLSQVQRQAQDLGQHKFLTSGHVATSTTWKMICTPFAHWISRNVRYQRNSVINRFTFQRIL